jgi:hypothetical protein
VEQFTLHDQIIWSRSMTIEIIGYLTLSDSRAFTVAALA